MSDSGECIKKGKKLRSKTKNERQQKVKIKRL